MMTASLRELGFENVTGTESLAEAVNILEAEPVDWLITSAFLDGKANVLQLLKLAREVHSLASTLVSLYTAEEELYILPKAFSLGLFSNHLKPFNKDSFQADMKNALETLKSCDWNATLASATYLRRLCKDNPAYKEAHLQFATAMNQAYPEDVEILYQLAEAHLFAGNHAIARACLWQVMQRQPAYSSRIEELLKQHLSHLPNENTGSQAVNVETAVILDPDSAVLTSMQDALSSFNVKDVQTFDNGLLCWEWLQSNKEPDLLIMEWRVPGLATPLLIQRCRSIGYHAMSVIIHSSLLQKQEEPLLYEIGVNDMLQKPFRRDDFLNCVSATLSQWERPTKQKTLETKIRVLLAGGQVTDAMNHMQLYLAHPNSDRDPTRRYIEAELAFSAGDFKGAKNAAMQSIQLGNKSVSVLNVLGKTLMRLNEYVSALKVFLRANEIAPNSITRLCAIAETQHEIGDNDATQATLQKLNDLDPDHQDVINLNVSIGLATGDKALVKKSIELFKPAQNILAYVNNKAVAHARAGEFDQSIELYENARKGLPDQMQRLRNIIDYNLALAFARKGDIEGTLRVLEGTGPVDDEALGRKISSLLNRCKSALAKGVPMILSTAGDEGAVVALEKADEVEAPASRVNVYRCCDGLFQDMELENEAVTKFLDKILHFQERKS